MFPSLPKFIGMSIELQMAARGTCNKWHSAALQQECLLAEPSNNEAAVGSSQALRLAASCINISHTLIHIQMHRPWGQEAELVWQLLWQLLWQILWVFAQYSLRKLNIR